MSIKNALDKALDRIDFEETVAVGRSDEQMIREAEITAFEEKARKLAAQRCCEIAGELSDSYGFPSEHAVGAETVAVMIAHEFGLNKHPRSNARLHAIKNATDHMDWLCREWIRTNPDADVLAVTVMQLAGWAKEQVK